MPKFTDGQFVILSAAARRQDGAVLPLPKSLKIKGDAVTKTLEGLRKKGLLKEKSAARNAAAWREGDDGRRMMLVIADAGLQAIGVDADEKTSKQPTRRAKKRRGGIVQKPITATPKGKKSQTAARQGTKQALLINLLKRKKGATIKSGSGRTGPAATASPKIARRPDRMKPEPLNAGCTREIVGLCGLSRADLVERWVGLHGSPPVKTMTKGLLARGIAYEMQIRRIGGLTPAERKALGALAQGRPNPHPVTLKTGTRLYRSWRGVTQEILVLESGFSWQGLNYASLSEVARAITGTRWSGPRFFGLQA
jgi:hypothetical protein